VSEQFALEILLACFSSPKAQWLAVLDRPHDLRNRAREPFPFGFFRYKLLFPVGVRR
jgi:hypothetical protein